MAGINGPSGLTNTCSHGYSPSIHLSRVTADATSGDYWRPRETSGDHGRRRMLVYKCKLRLSRAQAMAIEEAIRTTQVIRTKSRAPVDGWARTPP